MTNANTATERLRELLDERGVKYETKDRPAANHADWGAWMHGDGHQPSGAVRRETLWGQPTDQNGEALKGIYHAKATEMGGRLFLEAQLVTPEQAIDATLGNDGLERSKNGVTERGTCHDAGGTDENGQQVFNCDACGCVLSLYHRDGTNTMCTHFIYDYPRFCPACGREVMGE